MTKQDQQEKVVLEPAVAWRFVDVADKVRDRAGLHTLVRLPWGVARSRQHTVERKSGERVVNVVQEFRSRLKEWPKNLDEVQIRDVVHVLIEDHLGQLERALLWGERFDGDGERPASMDGLLALQRRIPYVLKPDHLELAWLIPPRLKREEDETLTLQSEVTLSLRKRVP